MPSEGPSVAQIAAMARNINSVLLGAEGVVNVCLAAALAGHHVLLNDEPGVGKTTLARALARSLGGTFSRVQGTVDLLPGDLTGVSIVDPASGQWAFRPGPILHDVLLVDEINRLSPRTQSALLEAMAEGQVTVDGTAHVLPAGFVVLATMNPTGSVGTFPLAAGQLDRFGVSTALGPAGIDVERQLMIGSGGMAHVDNIIAESTPAEIQKLRLAISRQVVDPSIIEYVLAVVKQVRNHGRLSTRAPLTLVAVAKAWSLLAGRGHVSPDDVKAVGHAVLAHRLEPSMDSRESATAVVIEALATVPVPRS